MSILANARHLSVNAGKAAAIAFIVVGALTATASASQKGPFKGSFTEQFTPTTVCPTGDLCANATGTGKASVIHNATETFYGVANLAFTDQTTGCAPDSATGVINGTAPDAIYVSSAGKICITSATSGTDNGDFLIVGGTGRFAGASGSGTYTSTLTLNPDGTGSSVEMYTGSAEIVN